MAIANPRAEWPRDGLEAVPRCPVCDGGKRAPLHEAMVDWVFGCAPGTWSSYRCADCGTAYLDPRPTAETIGIAYREYYTHGNEGGAAGGGARQALKHAYLNARYGYRFAPALPWLAPAMYLLPLARLRSHRTVRWLPRREGGRLLDVGCGNGAFLELMRSQGWDVHGVDLDPGAVAACRARGLDVQQGTVHDASFPEGFFDAITLNHVIEHLPDPVAVLERCRTLTVPRGRLFLETPNLASAGSWRFGRHWMPLDPPRHLYLMGPDALRRLCLRAGWPAVQVGGALGAHGIAGWARILREREATGSSPARQRTRFEAAVDWLLDVVGALAPRRAENLVAFAERGEEA